MKAYESALNGVLILEPRVFADDRGFFLECYQARRFREVGLDAPFVQDNHSRSSRGVLRGLHFQRTQPQGKLVYVVRGHIFDVVVDIKKSSPTFGQYVSVELNDANHRQIYVPPGYAHGFCVISDVADVVYKCTDYYDPSDEGGLIWNDPQVNIEWPIAEPILSAKDQRYPTLEALTRQET
jgi:dTDP-4-dehydrorhamnose 3,5-epimerase